MSSRKSGFAYWAMETDRYNDIRIRRLVDKYKTDGIAIYDRTVNEIYRVKGYFILWNEKECFDIALYFKLPESLVNEIICFCSEIGLFDKKLFEVKSILTSHSIQVRFLDWSKKAKRTDVKVISAFKLQEESDILQEESPKLPEKTDILLEVSPEVTEHNITKQEGKESLPPPHLFFYDILNDKIFAEGAMIAHRIKDSDLETLLRKFFDTKKTLRKDHWKDLTDCRNNFYNWIKFELVRREEKPIVSGNTIPISTTYTAPTIAEVEAIDPHELAEKNKKAGDSIMRMIEADIELFTKNDQCRLMIPHVKFQLLIDRGIVQNTDEEKKNYLTQAREKRITELNSKYDTETRIILRHYEDGKTPESEKNILRSNAMELAYRDYLRSKSSKEVAVMNSFPPPKSTNQLKQENKRS